MAKRAKIERVRLRLYVDGGGMFGPGKADLLELIAETGSIAAAGRSLGMSYKRAWGLVETMNAMFATPLVERSRGGAAHGGAKLTPRGEQVLRLYRTIEGNTLAASARELRQLERQLAEAAPVPPDMSERK